VGPKVRPARPETQSDLKRKPNGVAGSSTRGRLASLSRKSLPALLSGVGLALSIPPWGFWILAFPSAALLWWVLGQRVAADDTASSEKEGQAQTQAHLRLRSRLWIGWVAGVGLFGPGLYWAGTFNVYGGVVLVIVESLAVSLACAACGTGRGRIVALPGAMVLAEWIRDIWPFGGLPLGGIALGQVSGPLGGAARLGGPLLLTGLLWLAGTGIGSLVAGAAPVISRRLANARNGQKRPSNTMFGTLLGGAGAIAVVLAFAIYGSAAPNGGPAIRVINVASVQGGGARGLRKAQVNPSTVYDAQVDATAQLNATSGFGKGGASDRTLVVWPEDVVSITGSLVGNPVERSLAGIARGLDATLLVGVTETVSSQAFRNEAVAFSPSGSIVGSYEKVHRVPFGEYVPYRGFFSHLANLSSVPLDAIPGHSTGFLRTPAAPVGLMISYEVFFADAGRSATRAGAQLLVVPTNTSSYSTSQVPTQEVAAARLQAIEEGRDLVQAAPTGYSAIVDNDGRVLERSVLGARQVLVASVALRSGATIYERLGDLPVLVLAALALLLGRALDVTEPSLGAEEPEESEKSPAGGGRDR
jgi:apolipoprotein N-acyltransferase